jgi:hypothetical protein
LWREESPLYSFQVIKNLAVSILIPGFAALARERIAETP